MKLSTRMRHANSTARETATKALALLLSAYLFLACGIPPSRWFTPEPLPGHWDYQQELLIPVAGGEANVAGGNLMVRSAGLALDSVLGGEVVQPFYNSARNQWFFGIFDMFYDGNIFRDGTAAGLNAGTVPNGSVIPGTTWIKIDHDTLRLKGGLVFEFWNGRPVEAHRMGQTCPRIQYVGVREVDGEITIRQQDCASRGKFSTFNVDLFTLTFNGENQLVHVVDLAGREANYTWLGGQLVRAEAGGQDFIYGYGAFGGLLSSITNFEGEEIQYEYFTPLGGSLPRLQFVTQVDEENPQVRFDYYAGLTAGSGETVVTDALGDRRRFYFDAERRVSQIDYEAISESEYFTHNGAERQYTSHTLTNGTTTSYTRDAHENVLTVAHPTGNVVVHTYADANSSFRNHQALASKTDTVGPIATWTFTEDEPIDYKRLDSVTNGEDETTQYDYHPNAGFTRVAFVTFPNGVTKEIPETGYGPLGQVTNIGVGGTIAELFFDDAGNQIAGSDGSSPEIGGVLSRTFDEDHRPISATVAGTDGVEVEVVVVRRSDGQILSIDRPPLGLGEGPDERHAYDAQGRRIQEEKVRDGAWKVMVTYIRNARGITSALYADGTDREWIRDQAGRVTEYRVYDDQGDVEGEALFSYQNGNLIQVYDSGRGTTIHVYDPVTGLLQLSQHLDPNGVLTSMTRYEFDLRSRLTKKEYLYADGTPFTALGFEYDLANRKVNTTANGQNVLSKTYLNGLVECITTGNGLERCFTYDEDLGIRNGAITLNAAVEIVEATTLDVTVLEDPALWEMHTLTVAGDLAAEAYFTVGPGTDPDVPGSEVGKRILAWDNGVDTSDAYAYDALSNQVDDIDGDTYDYNLEGDLLLAAMVGGQEVTYTYDVMDRADSRNGLPIERRADGRKLFYDGYETLRDAQERPLRFTNFNVDPPQVRDWSLWGGEIEANGSGQPVSLDLGEVTIGFAGENTYKHLDFRGNVSFVSDESGAIVTLYEYSAYGVHAVMGDQSHPNRFVNQPSHGDLLELEARTCDMLVGRCLEPDPVPNLLNQYTYTLGNPIWFWDPDGRLSDVVVAFDVGLSAGGITIGIVFMVVVATTPTAPVLVVLTAVGLGIAVYGFARSLGVGNGWGSDINPDPAGFAKGAPESRFYSDKPLSVGGGSMNFVSGLGGFGSIGGFPSCGLLGIEFLIFVGWILGRKQKRAS